MARWVSTDAFALVQCLAICSMVVDHLGVVGILGDWSRMIGRFAMPAFTVMVVANAMMTVDPLRFFYRLFFLMLISQLPWMLSVGNWVQLSFMANLTFISALVLFYRFHSVGAALVWALVLVVVSPSLEYGYAPLLLVPFVLSGAPWWLLLALVWPLVQYPAQVGSYLASTLSIFLLVGMNLYPVQVPRLPRYVTRLFYPVHLTFLSVIKMM